jgi:hypothetical protein
MTRTPAARAAVAPHDTTTRPAVPAPRQSPENGHEQNYDTSPAPDVASESYGYPLIRYAMEHATALRPQR